MGRALSTDYWVSKGHSPSLEQMIERLNTEMIQCPILCMKLKGREDRRTDGSKDIDLLLYVPATH